MIYLDASLIVSAVVIEDASPQIVTWLLQQEPKSLIASDWALVEVASALAFKQRTGQISEDIRDQAIAAWSDMRASKVDLVPVPSLAFANAESWLNGGLTKLRSGDALHISIAQLGGYSLATLDKAMMEAAALLGVAVEPIS